MTKKELEQLKRREAWLMVRIENLKNAAEAAKAEGMVCEEELRKVRERIMDVS